MWSIRQNLAISFVMILVSCSLQNIAFSQVKSYAKKGGSFLSRFTEAESDPSSYILKPQYVVLSDEPYWLIKNRSYEKFYYNLLSGCNLGTYDLNLRTGSFRNTSEIDDLTTIKELENDSFNIFNHTYAQSPDGDLFITIAAYGDMGVGRSDYLYNNFFTNTDNQWEKLTKEIKDIRRKILTNLRTDKDKVLNQFGLIIDLQKIPNRPELVEPFREFIQKIRRDLLHKLDAKLILKLPIIHNENEFYYSNPTLLKKVRDHFDYVIYKNYVRDFDELNARDVPWLYENNFILLKSDIDSLVKLGVYREKLIIEFAYLGLSFDRDMSSETGKILSKEDPIISYKNASAKHRDLLSVYGDKDSFLTSYETQNKEHFFIYDSDQIRLYKYAKIRDLGVKGISLHGIGYNFDDTEGKSDSYWVKVGEIFGRIPESLWWFFFGTLFGFISLGFPYSVIKYWEVRNILAKYKKYIFISLGGWIFAVFGLLFCLNIIDRYPTGMYMGLGILIFFVLMILFRQYIVKLFKLFQK